MNAKTLEALPCPFCGGPGTIEIGGPHEPNDWCGYCPACDYSLEFRTTHAEALAAWNRRASSTARSPVERALAERARDSLKTALAPFQPLGSRALAEAVLAELTAALTAIHPQAEGETGWLPIVLCPTDGEWRAVKLSDGREVVAAFDGVGLTARGRWQTKAFAYRNPSRPTGEMRGGVEQHSAPFDTFVIGNLPDGVLPTHFRPNDTVYGRPDFKAPAPPHPEPGEL